RGARGGGRGRGWRGRRGTGRRRRGRRAGGRGGAWARGWSKGARPTRRPARGAASALDVRALLGHLPVADAEDVHAADAAGLPVAHPAVGPADDGAVAAAEHLLGLEVGLGRAREERLPVGPHGRLPLDPLAVRRRARAVEEAVVR